MAYAFVITILTQNMPKLYHFSTRKKICTLNFTQTPFNANMRK